MTSTLEILAYADR